MQKLGQKGFSALETILLTAVVLLAGGVGWYVYSSEQDKTGTAPVTAVEEEKEPDYTNNGYNTIVESGTGAFTITFPDGWGDILKDTAGDFFIILGTDQPEVKLGEPVKITDVSGYGSDNQSVFSVVLHDNFSAPEGVASDFTTGDKDKPLSGQKYILEYDKDTEVGIGYLRIKGDRDYTYVFDVGNGRELRVHYSVYGSDPRNNIETVDEVVRSIRLK